MSPLATRMEKEAGRRLTRWEISFWAINVGRARMVLLSMPPIGLIEAWASVE